MKKWIGFLLAAILAVLAPTISQARYLNPNTGRFQTMDSYEGNSQDPQSLHKYLYANTNPSNLVDPSGHGQLVEVMAAVGIATIVESLNTISVAYLSLVQGSLPDAYAVGTYFSGGLQTPGSLSGGLSAIGGTYHIFFPKEKKVAHYIWGSAEVTGGVDPDGDHTSIWHRERGVFEVWIWGMKSLSDDEPHSLFQPMLVGIDWGGNLYGVERSSANKKAVLFGKSNASGAFSVSAFALFAESSRMMYSSISSAGAMATGVAIAHAGIADAQTRNYPVNILGKVLGMGVNAGSAAYWVNHKYPTD